MPFRSTVRPRARHSRLGPSRRALLGGLAALAACSPRPHTPPVLDGPALRALTERRPASVLLVFDPAQCLSCTADMPRWLELRERHPGNVALLMTRAPSEGEAKYFTIARIPVDGVVGSDARLPVRQLPAAYVYHAGRLTAAAPLRSPAASQAIVREVGS